MNAKRTTAVRLTCSLVLAAGLGLAAVASACSDSRTSTACDSPSRTNESTASIPTTDHMIPEPTPDPVLETPVLSGFPSRAREPELRPLQNPLGWLLAGSGPRGGQKLSAERMGHASDRKPEAKAEAGRAAKSAPPRTTAGWSWSGFGSHISKPHRMPSAEIL